jgi:hypothetical protein
MRKSTHLKEEGFLMTNTTYRNEWESRVISFKSSGMGVTDWCKANDVKLERFKYWLYKRKSSNSAPATKNAKQWIAIETAPVASNIQEYALTVNVGQASIQIKPGFDPVLLSDVVKVLAGSC